MKRAIVLVGLVYAAVGVAFSTLHFRQARPAAWLLCAIIAAAQIVYEHRRLRNPPLTIALHAALAVAVGACGLAVAANIRVGFGGPPRLLLSVVTWPIVLAIPAFLAAWAFALVLARLALSRHSTTSSEAHAQPNHGGGGR